MITLVHGQYVEEKLRQAQHDKVGTTIREDEGMEGIQEVRNSSIAFRVFLFSVS